MNHLTPQIEDIVKCDDVDMAGVLGTLLATLDSADVLSLLDTTSLLKGAGGLGLDGLLGKEGNEDSSKPSSGSKATGGLNQLLPGGGGGLDSLLNLGGDKGSGKGLLKGEGLSSIKKPLNDMVENVDHLKDSVEAKVKEILPSDIKGPVSDLLKLNLKELLLEFQVDKVTVDSTDITMAADEIQVQSTVTATIGGKGILGPVISALKFESNMEVTMKIAISSNNTQCVNIDVQDTHFQVNEMKIQVIETWRNPTPAPSFLGTSTTAKMLPAYSSTRFKVPGFLPKDLPSSTVLKTILVKKTVPVPGRRLPPDLKNATISVTTSGSMMKILLLYVANQSSVKMNGLDANITKIAYAFQKDKQLRISYEVAITKDGEDFATGKTQLIISYGSKITKTKLEPNIKLIRSDHRVEPPEAKEEGTCVLSELKKAFWSVLNELYKQMNIIEGVSSFALMNANIRPLKSSDLQATN